MDEHRHIEIENGILTWFGKVNPTNKLIDAMREIQKKVLDMEKNKLITDLEYKHLCTAISDLEADSYSFSQVLVIESLKAIQQKVKNLESKIDWKKLREEYFNECTYRQFPIEKNSIKINMAPHDLFEWFKLKVDSYCL